MLKFKPATNLQSRFYWERTCKKSCHFEIIIELFSNEVSISYTRGNIAATATYLVSLTYAGPATWREAGRVNSNGYATTGFHNFTIDCNTQATNPRLRIRAINTYGVTTSDMYVNIKVRSINHNSSSTQLTAIGNDQTVTSFVPMTSDWSLYVGNAHSPVGASLAIKAIENGNVGIGTAFATEKLSLKGKIRAQEIKVDNANWPDFVGKSGYKFLSLAATEKHIKEKGYLPGIPSAKEVRSSGFLIGDMNARLLQKIEEITLHLIEQNKNLEAQNKQLTDQQREIKSLKKKILTLNKTLNL